MMLENSTSFLDKQDLHMNIQITAKIPVELSAALTIIMNWIQRMVLLSTVKTVASLVLYMVSDHVHIGRLMRNDVMRPC